MEYRHNLFLNCIYSKSYIYKSVDNIKDSINFEPKLLSQFFFVKEINIENLRIKANILDMVNILEYI